MQEHDRPGPVGVAAPVLDQGGVVDEVAEIASGVSRDTEILVLITRPSEDFVSL